MSNSNQKLYVVTIEIRMGEYEKDVTTFRLAESKEDAEYDALSGETHNDGLTREQFDNGEEWWDDYMVYVIGRIEECDKSVIPALKEAGVYIFEA